MMDHICNMIPMKGTWVVQELIATRKGPMISNNLIPMKAYACRDCGQMQFCSIELMAEIAKKKVEAKNEAGGSGEEGGKTPPGGTATA